MALLLLPKGRLVRLGQKQMCHLCGGEKIKTQKGQQWVSAYSLSVWNMVYMYLFTCQNGLLFSQFLVVCFLLQYRLLRLQLTFLRLAFVRDFRAQNCQPSTKVDLKNWTGIQALHPAWRQTHVTGSTGSVFFFVRLFVCRLGRVLGQTHSLPSLGWSMSLCGLAMCVAVKGWLSCHCNLFKSLLLKVDHFSWANSLPFRSSVLEWRECSKIVECGCSQSSEPIRGLPNIPART